MPRSRTFIAQNFADGEYADEVETINAILAEYSPNLIFSFKHGRDINHTTLTDGQQLNGFKKSACITTKKGLTKTMRNLLDYDSCDPDTVFPKYVAALLACQRCCKLY